MPKKVKFKPKELKIDIFSDDRGVFVPFLNTGNKLPESNLLAKRIYYIYDYGQGVVRGFHLHKKEWKYFIIVSGAAKFIAVNSDDPEEKYEFISSSRKPSLIIIPPGYANGWVSLEQNTILVCASTSSFEESIKDDIRIDPYKWGDYWSVNGR